jgi:hypothetical protein
MGLSQSLSTEVEIEAAPEAVRSVVRFSMFVSERNTAALLTVSSSSTSPGTNNGRSGPLSKPILALNLPS